MAVALILGGGEDAFTSSRDSRTGIVTALQKCWAPDYASALTSPALGCPDGITLPEWGTRKIAQDKAGRAAGYTVFVPYEGHPFPDDSGEFFEWEGSTTEDPVETHWNYEVLLANYNGREDSNGRGQWPKTLTDKSTGKSGRNKMHGVTSWPAPGAIWNHNWVTKTFPDSIVSTLGTITTTPPGNPPAMSGGRVWLLMRIRGRQRGNVWQMQTSYMLSGPNGYVPEMYQQV